MSRTGGSEPTARSRPRSTARLGTLAAGLVTLLSVALLLGVLLVGLVGWRPMATGPASPASTDASGRDTEPLPGQVARLRSIPLVMPDGGLAAELKAGFSPVNVQDVHAIAAWLADRAGLVDTMPELWDRLEHVNQGDWQRRYPYEFPGISDWLRTRLTPAVLEDRADLLDLAGVLVMDAGHRESTVPVADYVAGAAAWVILQALAATYPDDCDVALDTAGLVSLGQRPRAWVVDRAFRRAVRACPDDPSPRWWWVHHQALWSWPELHLAVLGVPSAAAMARPLRTAHRWQREQPGSALAWAAEADALLTQAGVMHQQRVMPFTVRDHARRALALMVRADGIEHDPAFVAGQARALALLGRPAEAADLMAKVVAEVPRDGSYRVLDVALLEQAHRWDAAAEENAHIDVELAEPGVLVPTGLDPTQLGATRATAVTVADPTATGLGAGAVTWLGYIPDYRDTQTLPGTTTAWCYGLTVLRLAVVRERPTDAAGITTPGPKGCWGGLTASFHPGKAEVYLPEYQELEALLAQQAGDIESRDSWLRVNDVSLGSFFDDAQNLFRWAGDLDRAEEMTRAWSEELPDDAAARQRAGEVAYLQGRYDDAADLFEQAAAAPIARTFSTRLTWSSAERTQANLDLGTALETAGRPGPALAAYRDAADERVPPWRYDPEKRDLRRWSIAAAWSRIGYAELAAGATATAVKALREADARVTNAERRNVYGGFDPVRDSLTSGAEANNLAVALLDDGEDADGAVDAASRAVAHDPASPVYRDTLGQALQLDGRPGEAAAAYLAAVREDDTLFQSWNNLGVVRAEQGERDRAVHAFRMAVRARPDYALAWFNLGGELGRGGGPRDFVASQRALARAVRLDPGLRGQAPMPLADTGAEITGLDVSRPVPADWTFGSTTRDPTPAFGWVVLVLAVWRLLLSLGLDHAGSWAGERALGGTAAARGWAGIGGRLDRYVPLPVALAGAVAVLAWPMARSTSGQWWQLAATLAALGGLVWLFSRLGRRGSGANGARRGWLPGMAFGALSAVVGYAFVPMPVAGSAVDRRARWAGCVLLGATAALLLVLAWFAGTPLLRVVGLAALAMLSTALFPLKPYDGGFLKARGPSVLLSLALLGISSAVVLGWI